MTTPNISRINSILPSSRIKSISLSDPSTPSATTSQISIVGSKPMTIKVAVSSLTSDNSLRVNSETDITNFFKVAIIQSLKKETTDFIKSLGEDILNYIGPKNDWRGNEKFDDLYYTNVLQAMGQQKSELAKFKKATLNIQTKKMFDRDEELILERIDDEGSEMYMVPTNFSFTIASRNPSHLTYFVLSYIDEEAYRDASRQKAKNQRFGADIDLSYHQNITKKKAAPKVQLEADTVFESGIIPESTIFFKTPDNKLWTGPVHQMGRNGKYMTGLEHTDSSRPLKTINTKNLKIKDFRIQEALRFVGVMNDFQDEMQELVSFPKNPEPSKRKVAGKQNSAYPYLSQNFISMGSDRTTKMMFMVDVEQIFKKHSPYGKAIKTSNRQLKAEILSKYIVKSVKVFREQVRKTQSSNKVGSPVDKYVPMKKEPTLIAFSSQEPNQKLINKKSNIAEENNMSIEAQGIRTFNVLDDTLDFSNPSLYRYRVEMEIYDDTKKYFQDKIFQLRAFLTVLNNYRSSIENSTVQSKGKRNFNSKTRRVGGFNRKMDSLTQDFADLMRSKYDTSLKEMLATFMNMYKLFLPKEAINQSQEQRITNFFGLASNPSSTNPTALLALIELVQGMTDKLISVVPDSSVASSPSSFPSQSIKKDSRATKNTIYVNNVFANIIDLTKFSSGGYDYLSKNIPSSFSSARLNVGLRSVPGAEFKGRIKQETLKYFTKETPDLTNGMVGGTPPVKYTSEDQVLNSSYTFFSPAVIRTHKGNYAIRSDTYNDFSLCGQIQREIVSTKLNSMSNPYSPLSATEGGTVDAAIDSENYLLKNYNTRLERKKVMTLQQRKNLGLRLPSESEPVPNNQDAVISTERRIETNMASDLLKLLTSRQSSIDPASSGHSFKTPLGKGDDFSNFYNLNNPKNYLNTVQTSQATRLPNQIKSLFMTVTGNLKDVKNRPFGSKNIFSNPDEAGASFLRYRLLVSVEYLTGFGKSGTNFSESVMQKPVWAPLDAGSFSALSGRKLLCRLKKFEISNWGITRPKQMDMGIYDEYFVLVPDTPVTSPQDSINPQDVVFDTLQNPPTPAPGFRELEKDLAPLASFGRTTKPGKKYRPNSGKIRNIVSKIGTLTEKISSNLVSDAFNANQSLVYSDGRRKLKASEKVTKDKESPISKRISKMRGDRINPSIKPSKGKEATRTSNASEFSILDTAGDLPQLRQQLIQIRASGNFIAQKNNNSQKRIEQLTEAKLDGERKINNLKQKEQIDKEMTRVDRMDNIIISSKKQIEKEKKNMLKLKKEEKRVEQQIYQETKRIQQKIQSLPDQGSQAGKTKDPFNSTKNLQSSFVEDLNKIAVEQAMTSKAQIDRINKYKGYLAEGDAKELDGLVKELQEQMIEKAHVSYDAGKSDSTSYGVEKAKESYSYTSAVSDVSDVVSVLDAAGTSAGYVREAAQDLAQKIIGKAKMDNQTKALAVESVVSEAYKLKGKKGR